LGVIGLAGRHYALLGAALLLQFRKKFANMRKYWFFIGFGTMLSFLAISTSSCSPKVGCPVNEAAHVKPNRKGELPTSGGKSGLFPKDFNKKKKKKRRN
jgi:hypothetical protein